MILSWRPWRLNSPAQIFWTPGTIRMRQRRKKGGEEAFVTYQLTSPLGQEKLEAWLGDEVSGGIHLYVESPEDTWHIDPIPPLKLSLDYVRLCQKRQKKVQNHHLMWIFLGSWWRPAVHLTWGLADKEGEVVRLLACFARHRKTVSLYSTRLARAYIVKALAAHRHNICAKSGTLLLLIVKEGDQIRHFVFDHHTLLFSRDLPLVTPLSEPYLPEDSFAEASLLEDAHETLAYVRRQHPTCSRAWEHQFLVLDKGGSLVLEREAASPHLPNPPLPKASLVKARLNKSLLRKRSPFLRTQWWRRWLQGVCVLEGVCLGYQAMHIDTLHGSLAAARVLIPALGQEVRQLKRRIRSFPFAQGDVSHFLARQSQSQPDALEHMEHLHACLPDGLEIEAVQWIRSTDSRETTLRVTVKPPYRSSLLRDFRDHLASRFGAHAISIREAPPDMAARDVASPDVSQHIITCVIGATS